MTRLPGVSSRRAIRAFEKAGFWVIREGKHTSMTNGERIIVIPRAPDQCLYDGRDHQGCGDDG